MGRPVPISGWYSIYTTVFEICIRHTMWLWLCGPWNLTDSILGTQLFVGAWLVSFCSCVSKTFLRLFTTTSTMILSWYLLSLLDIGILIRMPFNKLYFSRYRPIFPKPIDITIYVCGTQPDQIFVQIALKMWEDQKISTLELFKKVDALEREGYSVLRDGQVTYDMSIFRSAWVEELFKLWQIVKYRMERIKLLGPDRYSVPSKENRKLLTSTVQFS